MAHGVGTQQSAGVLDDQPFMYAEALAAGQTKSQLRWRHRTGAVRRLRRGVYIGRTAAGEAGPAELHAREAAAAALTLAGDPVASHESAAALWGIPTLRAPQAGVQLTRPRRRQGTVSYPGVVLHHAAIPRHHRAVRLGAPVTSPARTVVDIARARSFRAGVVAADAALRLKLCTTEQLLAVCADCTRWPGVRRARAVAEFADPLAESPLESLSRAAFHEHDVPAPMLQAWVTDYDRVDFLWPKQRVIGEADGLGKYIDREALQREKSRQNFLERIGYAVVRWTWNDIFRRPDAVADWLRTALHRPR